ncbi:MAG: pyridoxal-dependent decarboxylase [Candidatus Melainabacteria bacterium]|nr:pyridoxal-dependent decarboxylase [Candidatus Melainabacteria bacterium]
MKYRELALDDDFSLNPEYQAKLDVIENGGLNGEMIDETHHFDQFFPSLEKFLRKAVEYSQNPNKTVNMNYLDYGIHVPDELGVEQEAIDYVLPFYNSIDSRTGLDWRNVMPITLLPAVLGALGAVIVNPNLVTSKYGKRANELELRVVKSLAKILGFKDIAKAGGLSLEGGTKGNMYGYIFGLRKAFPQIKETGLMDLKQKFLFINSQAGHFSNFTNLAAIGVGRQNSIRIPCNSSATINIEKLRETLGNCMENGIVVPTVLVTVGTTDACAIDDVKAVREVIDQVSAKFPEMHKPHLHIDAAIGWAFAFFNDYDCKTNPLHFTESFIHKLPEIQNKVRHLGLADSITVDVHKTGFTPYSCSFLVVKNKEDFEHLMWDASEFKYFDPSEAKIAPVQYSLECTRSSIGIYSAAMAFNTLGIEGYQTLLGASLQYSDMLKHKFMSFRNIGVINTSLGFTTLFRPYPSFVQNAEALLEREVTDENFQKQSKRLSEFVDDFYKFWELHKKPDTPLLDHIKSGAWGQYGNHDYELTAWKAYLLNPRAGRYIKDFLEEFLALRNEYERQLPEEYLAELKVMLEE